MGLLTSHAWSSGFLPDRKAAYKVVEYLKEVLNNSCGDLVQCRAVTLLISSETIARGVIRCSVGRACFH